MASGIAGKVAVVTGAGSGIGRSTALLLARRGARVHVADIDGETAEAVRADIERGGGTATAHTVDCSDPEAVEAFAERVFAADGRVDVLHNNAGIGHAGDLEATTAEDWRRVIEVNLLGVAYGIQAFAPRILAQGAPAAIVNTASAAGLFGLPRMAPYCASKFGVVGLSEALDAELAPRGVRVTAICPGIIDTPITRTSILRGSMGGERDEIVDLYRRRGASPDDVAETVLAAVERHRPVRTVPVGQVTAIWALKRASPRAWGFVIRNLARLRDRR
jgi:NAD(P)-dependent dehydrogenase (short-subunit alcohol dehydrogenase family)